MANPFMTGAAPSLDSLPIYKEYAWDFTSDRFVRDSSGKKVILTGNDALKVWVYKLLRVERYRYRAYFDDYGVELEKYIGRTNSLPVGEELYQDVEDALLVNPYIVRVQDISVTQTHKKIQLAIKLTTIYGDTEIGVEL